MSEPEEIVEKVVNRLVPKQDLKDKHVLVTAGGTREPIDPVRYISNRSSGKMGYAIARAARERGATVTLISGPTHFEDPLDIKSVRVESAGGMLEAVLDYYNNADALIMAAAVSDFSPKMKNKRSKIKRKKENIAIELKPTEDILKTIAMQKGRKSRVLVGFALETEDVIKNARLKMKEKDLDLIVSNDPSTFESQAIKFSIIGRDGKIEDFPLQPKNQAAHIILDRVADLI